MKPFSHALIRSRAVPAFLLAGLLAACAAGVPTLVNAGLIGLDAMRKFIGGVAAKNYGSSYQDNAEKMFVELVKPATGGKQMPGAPGTPGAQPLPPGLTTAPTQPGGLPPLPPGQPLGTQPGAAPLPGQPGLATLPPLGPLAGPLLLEVGLFKEEIIGGRSIPVPVKDGDTLYDPYGTHGEGDNIRFQFRASQDCFVYVVSIDGTGWVQPVFPSSYSDVGNPVKANQTVTFPKDNRWVHLDSYRGVEHLYFVASKLPRKDLEASLIAFAAMPPREMDSTRTVGELVAQNDSLAHVEEPAVARGFGSVRESVVPNVESSKGEKFPVDAQIFAATGSGDVVVTRWFRHE